MLTKSFMYTCMTFTMMSHKLHPFNQKLFAHSVIRGSVSKKSIHAIWLVTYVVKNMTRLVGPCIQWGFIVKTVIGAFKGRCVLKLIKIRRNAVTLHVMLYILTNKLIGNDRKETTLVTYIVIHAQDSLRLALSDICIHQTSIRNLINSSTFYFTLIVTNI